MQLDTTHIWTEASSFLGFNQLSEYKRMDNEWWVYSDLTGWRRSGNDDEWFETEAKEGYFVKVQAEK